MPQRLLDPTVLAFVVVPAGLVVTLGWRHLWRSGPRAVSIGRPARWALIGLIFGVAAVVVLVAVVGLDPVAAVLGDYRPWLLGVAVALQGAVHVAMAQVYRGVFGLSGGRLARGDALRISLTAYACMQMLPAGGVVGGAYAAHQLARRGADHVAAATTVVLYGLVSMGTLATLLSVGTTASALVTGTGGAYVAVSLTMACVFFAGILLVHLSLSRPRWRRRVGTQVARLRWRGRAPFANVIDGLEQHRDLLRRPRAVATSILWSALAWSSGITMFAVLVQAAGGASFTAILISFAVAHLLNGLPFTPGGIGLVELGMAGTLIALGTDPAVASVAVVSYRLVASWLPVGVAVTTAGLSVRAVMSAPEVAR